MEAYGYFKDGEIVAPVAMCSRFDDVGAWHTLTDEERALHSWYPCRVDDTSFDPITQYRGSPVVELIDGIIYYQAPIHNKELGVVRQELIQSLSDCVQTFRPVPIVFQGQSYSLSDLDKLIRLSNCTNIDVLINHNTRVVKLTIEDLNILINKLLMFEQKLLTVQFETQTAIDTAKGIEELLAIDPQTDLMNTLEN